ncbi:MAG: bifunctional folylpolyglutamate synthase/dihydrofolate synthase [Lachnospiraceae bacterium]|nr:bifunctional folylpolyglutamate synthase/dihydrofolate synthase [Lachnospiraceae bacterium]
MSADLSYSDTEKYILDIPKFAGKHTLEDTRKLFKKLVGEDFPGKVIHIAGTNGKGSVCAYLRSILMKSGCSVGMFTSPHLEIMRERICLGEEMISEEEFTNAFVKVKQVWEALSEEADDEERKRLHPSFFEMLFLMAMVYFKEKEPDYIILETGLGGRLDATNIFSKPSVCVITEIGFDHMQYLGNTIEEIAAEKAGIIKSKVPVVFVNKRPEVTDILTEYAEKAKSQVYSIGKDSILNVNIRNKTIDFSFHSGYYNYDSLSLNTSALYQTENSSLAVKTAEILGEEDKRIHPESIREGLKAAHWPGRMEEVLPGVFLDGAHNEDGIEAFLHTVCTDSCNGQRFLLFGVVADKQYANMIKQIAASGAFAEVAVTPLESDRSVSIDRLREIWEQYNIRCSFHQNAEEAYHHLAEKVKGADVIYIAGSLYLIGQMKTLIRRISDD